MDYFQMNRQMKIDEAEKQKDELDSNIDIWRRQIRLVDEANNRILTPEELAFMPGEFRNRRETAMKSISKKNKAFGV